MADRGHFGNAQLGFLGASCKLQGPIPSIFFVSPIFAFAQPTLLAPFLLFV